MTRKEIRKLQSFAIWMSGCPYDFTQNDHYMENNYLFTLDLDHDDICKKAIEKWGRDVQINKIQEEALELALVLNQRNCPTKGHISWHDRLIDELADMKIMMAQAEILFDADLIEKRVRKKLLKLELKYLK